MYFFIFHFKKNEKEIKLTILIAQKKIYTKHHVVSVIKLISLLPYIDINWYILWLFNASIYT